MIRQSPQLRLLNPLNKVQSKSDIQDLSQRENIGRNTEPSQRNTAIELSISALSKADTAGFFVFMMIHDCSRFDIVCTFCIRDRKGHNVYIQHHDAFNFTNDNFFFTDPLGKLLSVNA